MKRYTIHLLITVTALAYASLSMAQDVTIESILARIKAPTFPDRDFVISDHGAKVGEESTDAIHAAIEACHRSGGGRVVVPAGEWLTGAIHLKSNVNLHVSEGATLRWVFDLKKYPVVFTRWEGVECMNHSPFIYAFDQENIAITGKGTLDGGSDYDTWWSWNDKREKPTKQVANRNKLIAMGRDNVPVDKRLFGKISYLRPNFIQPYKCRNILIEGVRIIRSPMWEVHPVLSQNITVRGLHIETHGPNNDGCNPESCTDVLIENTLFDTGDDCIAIKSGRNNDGRRVNVPTENVVIRNCTMKDGHGGVVLGSECSGGIRNVFVENCEMDSPELDRALRFKNNAVRGGVLENVFMRNVKIGQVREAVVTIDLLYEEGAKGNFMPTVRNVELDNVTSSASPRVLFVRGFEGAIIDDIRIKNSTFQGVTDTEVVTHTGKISFENVTIVPDKLAKGRNSVPAPTSAGLQAFKELKLGQIRGLSFDKSGAMYVPDLGASKLYKITSTGEISLLPTAPIKHMHAPLVLPNGSIYVVETEVSRVHRLVKSGAEPLVPIERKDVFLGATSIVCDAQGNLYIGENDVNIVRKMTPEGEFSIYAGAFKEKGNADGPAADARFNRPRALAIDQAGNVFVGDESSHVIRKITPEGQVSTVAGKAGEAGHQDGAGGEARFSAPRGLAADTDGNVYVMDTGNHTIRKITPDGKVTTIVGSAGEAGFIDGVGASARLAGPRAAAFDPQGKLYIADSDNGAIRILSPNGRIETILAASRPPSS